MLININSLQETEELGKIFANCLQQITPFPALLLEGDLGSGKTTFVKALTQSLPGNEQSEVSSPSFNILNIYPTKPEIAHFDLYRLEYAELDPEMEDILLSEKHLSIVEWSQFLHQEVLPDNYLYLKWKIDGEKRKVNIKAIGISGNKILNCLQNKIDKE